MTVNGAAVSGAASEAAVQGSGANAFFSDPATGTILIKVFDSSPNLTAQVQF